MDGDKQLVRGYFGKLGLDSQIADIYLSLSLNGAQTMSELSRSSGIERTRLYRLINQLLDSSLIEVDSDRSRALLRAAPLANLRALLARRDQELRSLQDELTVVEQLFQTNLLQLPDGEVQAYHGSAGLRQMLQHIAKAPQNSTICSILDHNLPLSGDAGFYDSWVTACRQHKLQFQTLVSPQYAKAADTWLKAALTKLDNENRPSIGAGYNMMLFEGRIQYYFIGQVASYGLEMRQTAIFTAQMDQFQLQWQAIR